MKNIIWAFIGLFMLFAACNSDHEEKTNLSDSATKGNNHFYGVKYPQLPETRGIAQRSKLWHPSANIKVKFLNGTTALQNKVKTYAKEWEKHISVRFEFVTQGNADVRIGFDWNDERWVTWSYIGTDCKFVTNQNEATMSFAYFDTATEKEIKADVLLAFGQVLGLELEHRHLSFNAGWTSKIADYWEGEIEDIPWETLKQYVFDPLLSKDVIQTKEYDPNSIMIWPFARKYADNTARDTNYELSQKDIEFLRSLYPLVEDGVAIVMRTIKNPKEVYHYLYTNNSDVITLDWGDGNIENLTPHYDTNSKRYFTKISHKYTSDHEYIIKINANAKSILEFIRGSFGSIAQLDISKCVNIERIDVYGSTFTSLDISKNTSLKILDISYTFISNLDVSSNITLEHLSISGTPINKLDVSKNTNLRGFALYGSVLENDVTELINFARTLPYCKNPQASGKGIICMSNKNIDKIQSIVTSKNWSCSTCPI